MFGRVFGFLLLVTLFISSATMAETQFKGLRPGPPAQKYLLPNEAEKGKEAQAVIPEGAKRIDLPEFNTYAVVWFPKNYAQLKDHRALFILHGSFGNAYMGIYHQLAMAKKYGLGLISLQWWRGGNQYMEPQAIEAALFKVNRILAKDYPINPLQTGLETFSRSGSISYEIAYWNKALRHPLYKLIIVQSGGIPPDNPRALVKDMLAGNKGAKPLKDDAFFMYCGEKDREWGTQQCTMMRNAQKVIGKLGGSVVRLIDDPNGGHGGLHNTPAYFESAMQTFIARTTLKASKPDDNCCTVRR